MHLNGRSLVSVHDGVSDESDRDEDGKGVGEVEWGRRREVRERERVPAIARGDPTMEEDCPSNPTEN